MFKLSLLKLTETWKSTVFGMLEGWGLGEDTAGVISSYISYTCMSAIAYIQLKSRDDSYSLYVLFLQTVYWFSCLINLIVHFCKNLFTCMKHSSVHAFFVAAVFSLPLECTVFLSSGT